MTAPNPTRCGPIRFDAADRRQRLDCARRSECLLVAGVGDWPGFTCNACDAYEPQTQRAHEQESRALSLLAEAIAPPARRFRGDE